MLEFALNTYLKQDPDTVDRLAALQGKTIELIIEDWNIRFFILPNQQGLELQSVIDYLPDTRISGTLNSFIQLGLAKGSNEALFKNKIQVSGDIHTGEAIQHILSQIDIDWEEQLSKIIGDIGAHKVGLMAKTIQSTATRTLQTLELNIKEFLQLELQVFPTAEEVKLFIENISTLRHAVDRLEARLHHLLIKRTDV